MERSYSFAPLIGEKPTVLILGTLPSRESLRLQQYYGNKRNRFWRILSSILGEQESSDYDEKVLMLEKHGIALWDVAHSAVRPGSLDTNITDEEMNPIEELLTTNPSINTVVFNGKAAAKKYKQHGG